MKTIQLEMGGQVIAVPFTQVAGVLPVPMRNDLTGEVITGSCILFMSEPTPIPHDQVLAAWHQATTPSRVLIPTGPVPEPPKA